MNNTSKEKEANNTPEKTPSTKKEETSETKEDITKTETKETTENGGAAAKDAVTEDDKETKTNEDGGTSQPLHRTWVLWFDNPRFAEPGASWRDNLKQCGEFSTPEQFWRVYNNVKPTSQLPSNSNYHLFRSGVEPMWEDPANVKGGKFVLSLPKKESKGGKLDAYWLYTVLAVVGETLDINGDQVCGAVVSLRKSQDRIALWLKTDDRDTCIRIGELWKTALNLPQKVTIKYQLHKEAVSTGSSFKNEIQFEV